MADAVCWGRKTGSVFVGEAEIRTHHVTDAADPVIVATFDGGGIIAYERPDGPFVITLNTPDGLARKLEQPGIDLAR